MTAAELEEVELTAARATLVDAQAKREATAGEEGDKAVDRLVRADAAITRARAAVEIAERRFRAAQAADLDARKRNAGKRAAELIELASHERLLADLAGPIDRILALESEIRTQLGQIVLAVAKQNHATAELREIVQSKLASVGVQRQAIGAVFARTVLGIRLAEQADKEGRPRVDALSPASGWLRTRRRPASGDVTSWARLWPTVHELIGSAGVGREIDAPPGVAYSED